MTEGENCDSIVITFKRSVTSFSVSLNVCFSKVLGRAWNPKLIISLTVIVSFVFT